MTRRCAVWILVALLGALVAAQQSKPQFEVASVRLSSAPGSAGTQRITESRVDLQNISLKALVRMAFRVRDFELFAPDWLVEVRVNVQATLPAGSRRQQVPDMLQDLLANRFGLVARRETRSMQVHELVVGSGGSKMREVEPLNGLDKELQRDPRLTSASAVKLADTSIDTPDGQVRTVFGELGRTTATAATMYRLRLNVPQRTQTLDATRMTMAELAVVLTDSMGQPVIDKTGLVAGYQFTVELPVDARTVQTIRNQMPSFEYLPGVSESRAVEAIGLKLERRTAPIPVLVVDKVNRMPSEN